MEKEDIVDLYRAQAVSIILSLMKLGLLLEPFYTNCQQFKLVKHNGTVKTAIFSQQCVFTSKFLFKFSLYMFLFSLKVPCLASPHLHL